MFTDPDNGLDTRAGGESVAPGRGRWIRPVGGASRDGSHLPQGAGRIEELGGQILQEAKRRIAGLAALERALEDKIRARWDEVELEVSRKLARAEEEASVIRRKTEGENKEKSSRLEKEGRSVGFREGFARGRDEGYRLGLEEGRREGERLGHEAASKRLEAELSTAIQAVQQAADQLRAESERLESDARDGLIHLAIEIAKKLVKREIRLADDVAVRNVERAIELIFRRGSLVVQVNPEDTPLVEKALGGRPRWAEGFDSVDVRASADIARGGCRLLSGAGICDLTIETQLGLIEDALFATTRGVHPSPGEKRRGKKSVELSGKAPVGEGPSS